MTIENYLKYLAPKYFSPGGKDSPVFVYLLYLLKSNPSLGKKAVSMLKDLNSHVYLNLHIKPFKQGKFRCWELRVQSKKDICRFFFIAEQPHFIVFHGFTKKTEKTDKRNIERGIKNLEAYLYSKNAINLDFPI